MQNETFFFISAFASGINGHVCGVLCFLTFSPWSFLGHGVSQAHLKLIIAEHRMKIRYITNITKNVFEGNVNSLTKETD